MNETTAARYQRLRRRARAAGVLGGALGLSLVALVPASRAALGRLDAALAAWPAGVAEVIRLFVLAGVVVGSWAVAGMAARALAGSRRAVRRPGLERDQPEGGAWASAGQVAVVALPLAAMAAGIVRLAAAVGGPNWWILAGAAATAGLLAALHAAPSVVGRLSGARRVEREALYERLVRLSSQAGVPVREFLDLPDGRRAATAALVSGVGASRRVFVSSELVRDWADEEIAVVVAHELGHHAHHDLWRAVALDGAILWAGLGASAAVFRLAPGTFGAAGAGALAAFPLLVLVTGIVWFLATPVRHAQSRHHERRADAFALALTGSADAFDTAIRRLGARHLAEERPGLFTRWLFHRHPSVAERLEFARLYRRAPET